MTKERFSVTWLSADHVLRNRRCLNITSSSRCQLCWPTFCVVRTVYFHQFINSVGYSIPLTKRSIRWEFTILMYNFLQNSLVSNNVTDFFCLNVTCWLTFLIEPCYSLIQWKPNLWFVCCAASGLWDILTFYCFATLGFCNISHCNKQYWPSFDVFHQHDPRI